MRFDEIIDVKHWQNIQDIFSSVVGISLRTVDEDGEVITRPSQMPAVCFEVVAESPAARKLCWQWYPSLSAYLKKNPAKKYEETLCPLGLVNFAVPFAFNGDSKAYVVLGPLVFENSKRDVRYSQRIQESGINEQKFFECYNVLPLVSAGKLDTAVDFLNSISGFVASLNSFRPDRDKNKDAFDKDKIGLLLKAFLELAMKLCDAERGSVMMFEKNSKELSIKDSKGLSEDIINKTKLKPGEGLAGLSIENQKPLFINDQLSDRELRLRMHRPKIKSAFVIPVFYKEEVLGVVSVGTTKKPNRFSDKLMELLNELVEMALEKVSLE